MGIAIIEDETALVKLYEKVFFRKGIKKPAIINDIASAVEEGIMAGLRTEK